MDAVLYVMFRRALVLVVALVICGSSFAISGVGLDIDDVFQSQDVCLSAEFFGRKRSVVLDGDTAFELMAQLEELKSMAESSDPNMYDVSLDVLDFLLSEGVIDEGEFEVLTKTFSFGENESNEWCFVMGSGSRMMTKTFVRSLPGFVAQMLAAPLPLLASWLQQQNSPLAGVVSFLASVWMWTVMFALLPVDVVFEALGWLTLPFGLFKQVSFTGRGIGEQFWLYSYGSQGEKYVDQNSSSNELFVDIVGFSGLTLYFEIPQSYAYDVYVGSGFLFGVALRVE